MEHPEVTVGAFVLNRNGEVLVLKSEKWRGNYTLVAGHVEFGENLETALRREVKEETGLDVNNEAFLYVDERVQEGGGEFHRRGHWVCLNYVCEAISEKVVLNDESHSFQWVSPEKLLQLPNVDSITRRTAERYLNNYGSRDFVDVPLGIYEHYKGNRYEVIKVGRHSESLGQMVVYRALYNSREFGESAVWVRPARMFVEEVVADGKKVPRFRKIA